MVTDRLVVNSALMRLAEEEWDEKAAKTVVNFGHNLPPIKPIAYGSVSRRQDGGRNVSGHTEHNDVTMKTSSPGKIKEVSWGELGIKKERIGYYELYKVRAGIIEFHYLWAPDITTQDENDNSPIYRIEYDAKTLTPYSLSVWKKKKILRIGGLTIVRLSLRKIHGKPRKFPTSIFGIKIN